MPKGNNNLSIQAPHKTKQSNNEMPQIMSSRYQSKDNLAKVQQMESKQKQQKTSNMANILKMQDKQMEKGLLTARKWSL